MIRAPCAWSGPAVVVCLSMLCFGGARTCCCALRIHILTHRSNFFCPSSSALCIDIPLRTALYNTRPHARRLVLTFVCSSTLSPSSHSRSHIHICIFRYPYALPLSRYLLTQCTALLLALLMQWIELLVENELRNIVVQVGVFACVRYGRSM